MSKEEREKRLQERREKEGERMENRLKDLDWEHIPKQFRPRTVKQGDKIVMTKEESSDEDFEETAVS